MGKPKFNQGNWVIHHHPDTRSIIGIATGEEFEDRFTSCGVTLYNQENDANAHLIAQAPAMYRMLQAFARGGGIQPGDTIEKLLARARGEYEDPAKVLAALNTEVNE